MSLHSVKFWPSANDNLATIAPLQVVGADLTVKIASNLPNMPNVSVNNSGVYQYKDMIRTISITSASNLAAINFTITGLASVQDTVGNPLNCIQVISEVVAGPNASTVQSVNLYSRIDSITTSVPTGAGQVSVGFGKKGITDYSFPNLNTSPPQHWAIQGQPVDATVTFNYQFYLSQTFPEVINDQQGNVTPYPAYIPGFSLTGSASHADPSYFPTAGTGIGIARMVWTNIDDSGAGNGNAKFYQTFIQQGITR